jgi:small subunit ribosomal protein S20
MPNIKSVTKDVIRSRQRRDRNNAAKSRMKTFVKKAGQVIRTGETAEIAQVLSETISVIDRTAKRGIIHKNAAARRKSRLMKRAAVAVKA